MPATTEMPLSEAINKGIAKRKLRAHGVHFAGTTKSDVLGAAYQGLTGSDEVHNYQVGAALETAFPVLKKTVDCPECGEVRKSLKVVLSHLNDQHRWQRKNIARFVKSLEDRASVQSVAVSH